MLLPSRSVPRAELAILVLGLVAWSGSSRAAPGASEAVPNEAAPASAVPSTPAAPNVPNGASLDFDLFGNSAQKSGTSAGTATAPSLDPTKLAKLDRQVKTRRRMLSVHQGFGFATLVVLAATCIIGQLNYQDQFGGGDFTKTYQYPHLGLAVGSAGLFATTGILGLAAPNPYPKPIKRDAALLHKIMMGVATAGMVTELILGEVTASQGGSLNQRNLAIGHLTTGYVTFAAMMTGYLAYVF